MNKLLLVFLALISAQSMIAQPAIFKRDVLTVPQGVVIDADSAAYYTDIQLSFDGADGFVLLAAEATKLVSVDALFVNILESFPVQITVSVTGNKSIPCVELLTPAISREDMVFTVVLAESKLGPEQSCIAIIDPFETSIVLDVAGLKAGTYIVRVNGVEAEFTLDIDNVAR